MLTPHRPRTRTASAVASFRWPLLILGFLALAFGALLFYWFQLRPMYVYRSCAEESSVDARTLLVNKARLAQDGELKAQYENLIKQNMYLRADYTSFLQKCLLHYGLPPVVQPGDDAGAG